MDKQQMQRLHNTQANDQLRLRHGMQLRSQQQFLLVYYGQQKQQLLRRQCLLLYCMKEHNQLLPQHLHQFQNQLDQLVEAAQLLLELHQ